MLVRITNVMRFSTLLAALLLLSGCVAPVEQVGQVDDPWGVIEVPFGEPIMIGVATALHGADMAAAGTDQLRGVELAIDTADRINGFAIEIVSTSSGCNEQTAIEAASELTGNPQIVATIGHTCAVACTASLDLFEQAHVPIISPSCSANELTDQLSHNDAFLRTMYLDSTEGTAAAAYAYKELGARQVTILHEGSLETSGLAAAFTTTFESLNGEIIASVRIEDEASLADAMRNVADNQPDLIYAPLLLDFANPVAQWRVDNDLQHIKLLGGRHYLTQTYLTSNVNAADIYASGPLVSGETYDNLTARYIAAYDVPPSSITLATAYDAANIILHALERVGKLSASGSLLIGRKALHDAIYSTAVLDSVTGSLTCTEWGDCSTISAAVWQITGDEWQIVYIPESVQSD